MKSYTRTILSLILIIVFALFTTQSVTVLATEGRTAKIYDFSNEVTVTRGKADLKAFKGMRLKEGDTIKTGKSSNAYIEIDSDKVIKLDSSTIVTISNMSGTDENGSINISLSSGKIYNDIKKKLTKNSTYKVRTPNAVMGVRGTTFVVDLKSLEDDGIETILTVFGGTVAFSRSEQTDSNVYVEINQTANTKDLTEGEKPIITDLDTENLSTFELTEIMKDVELQQNINKLLNKQNITLEDVFKKAEKQEKELQKQEKELQKQEILNQKQEQRGEGSNSNNSIVGSDNANENGITNPNTDGSTNTNGDASTNADENAGTHPSTKGNANANENAGAPPSTNSSTHN
jgi:hypothetical protein